MSIDYDLSSDQEPQSGVLHHDCSSLFDSMKDLCLISRMFPKSKFLFLEKVGPLFGLIMTELGEMRHYEPDFPFDFRH